MPRGVKKENLPSKLCDVCKRPFTWRKVWERCWDDVKTCSARCKAERKKQNKPKKETVESPRGANDTKETFPADSNASQMAVQTDNGIWMQGARPGPLAGIMPGNFQMPQLHHVRLLLFPLSAYRFLALNRLQCP